MILTITGASGAGKSTIFGNLLSKSFRFISSHTTRGPRSTDLPGEYISYTDKDFERIKSSTPTLWYKEFDGYKYMTTESSVLETRDYPDLTFGMLLIPDVIGKLKSYAEVNGIQVISVYIWSPLPGILEKRLTERGDSPESVKRRLALCKEWDGDAGTSGLYEYFITNNGTIEGVVQTVEAIIKENQR